MGNSVRVALVGFTRFEQATFEAFFRLATQRQPAYTLAASVGDCDTAIVNADHAGGVAEVTAAGLLPRALVLGATPRPGAASQLPRPINLMLVVRALDQVVRSAGLVQADGPSPGVQRVLQDLATVTSTLDNSVNPRQLAAQGAQAGDARRTPDPLALLQPGSAGALWVDQPLLARHTPAPAPPPAPAAPARTPSAPETAQDGRATLDHILVVDDSDIALRFMALHLQRFGFQVHLARSGAEAIERVSRRHFEIVFLDVMMEGIDGFHTCKAIKRATYPDNRPPPTVVMLTSRGTAVDKLRGTMAGADAYLTKPLREEELLKVVGDREVARHAYAETAHASSTLI